jgi:hypothetical protein
MASETSTQFLAAVRLLPTLCPAVVTLGKKASPNRRGSAHAADPVRYDY